MQGHELSAVPWDKGPAPGAARGRPWVQHDEEESAGLGVPVAGRPVTGLEELDPLRRAGAACCCRTWQAGDSAQGRPCGEGDSKSLPKSSESQEGFVTARSTRPGFAPAPSPAPIAPPPSWSQEVPGTMLASRPPQGPGLGDCDPLPARRDQEPARGHWHLPPRLPKHVSSRRRCDLLLPLKSPRGDCPAAPHKVHPAASLDPRLPCAQQSLSRAEVSGPGELGLCLGGRSSRACLVAPRYTLGARQPVAASRPSISAQKGPQTQADEWAWPCASEASFPDLTLKPRCRLAS